MVCFAPGEEAQQLVVGRERKRHRVAEGGVARSVDDWREDVLETQQLASHEKQNGIQHHDIISIFWNILVNGYFFFWGGGEGGVSEDGDHFSFSPYINK